MPGKILPLRLESLVMMDKANNKLLKKGRPQKQFTPMDQREFLAPIYKYMKLHENDLKLLSENAKWLLHPSEDVMASFENHGLFLSHQMNDSPDSTDIYSYLISNLIEEVAARSRGRTPYDKTPLNVIKRRLLIALHESDESYRNYKPIYTYFLSDLNVLYLNPMILLPGEHTQDDDMRKNHEIISQVMKRPSTYLTKNKCH